MKDRSYCVTETNQVGWEHLLILRHEELETVFTNKPKKISLDLRSEKNRQFLETDASISIPSILKPKNIS